MLLRFLAQSDLSHPHYAHVYYESVCNYVHRKLRQHTMQFVDVERYNSVSEGIKFYFSPQIQCECMCVRVCVCEHGRFGGDFWTEQRQKKDKKTTHEQNG